MKKVLLTTVGALAFGAAFAVPAHAQDTTMQYTINGNVVAEGEVAAVKERCEDLKLAEEGSITSDTEVQEPDPSTGGAEASTVTSVNLETLDYQACEEGGFYEDSGSM